MSWFPSRLSFCHKSYTIYYWYCSWSAISISHRERGSNTITEKAKGPVFDFGKSYFVHLKHVSQGSHTQFLKFLSSNIWKILCRYNKFILLKQMGCLIGDKASRANKSNSFSKWVCSALFSIWRSWKNGCYFMNWLVAKKHKWGITVMEYLWQTKNAQDSKAKYL